MRKIIVLFILCFIIGACNQNPKMRAFDKFKKHIPLLKFPYKQYCSDSAKQLKFTVSDTLFKKYAPPGTTGIIGMIKDTDYYTAILYIVSGDAQYPVIQTCNPEGTRLNDIGLINSVCCGNDANCCGYSWGEIRGDMQIILRDSEKIFGRDTLKHIYVKSKFKVINTTEGYHITDSGYIRLNTAFARH